LGEASGKDLGATSGKGTGATEDFEHPVRDKTVRIVIIKLTIKGLVFIIFIVVIKNDRLWKNRKKVQKVPERKIHSGTKHFKKLKKRKLFVFNHFSRANFNTSRILSTK
jgi:hypothetical protein